MSTIPIPQIIVPLSPAERADLLGLEAVVRDNMRAFVEMGQALNEIRVKRLYREQHATFEAYCEEVWNLPRSRAYQLGEAAANVEAVSKFLDTKRTPLPTNDAQARAISAFGDDDLRKSEGWAQAVERHGGSPPPARVVREVAAEMNGGPPPAEDDEDDEDTGGSAFDRPFVSQFSPSMRSGPPPAPAGAPPGKPAPPATPAIITTPAKQRSTSVSGHNTGNHLYFTPERYARAAERTFGDRIDLDPASCEEANRGIQALRFFTEREDGLAQSWKAKNLWLNCPYGTDDEGASNQGRWNARLIEEFEAGSFPQAITVINALTYAPWFQQLWPFWICFTNHRINFDQPAEADEKKSPRNGNAFVYLGHQPHRFHREFSHFGAVVRLVQPSDFALVGEP